MSSMSVLPYGLQVCGLRGVSSQGTMQSTAPMQILEGVWREFTEER